MAARSDRRPRGLLGTGRRAGAVVPQVGARARLAAAELPLVHGRSFGPRLQLRRSPRRGRSRRARRAHHRERARRAPHGQLRRASPRDQAGRGGPSRDGHPEGRPDRHLHADVGRGDRPDARRDPHRRGHPRRVRGIRRGSARGTHPPCRGPRAVRDRRHVSQRQGRAASRHRLAGDRGRADHRARGDAAPDRID